MKRYLNYLLILSNILVFIGVVIELGVFLNYKNNLIDPNTVGGTLTVADVIDKMQLVVLAPILFMIASCAILFFYEWKIKKLIKENIDEFNYNMLNIIKIVSYSSVVNYILTGLLGIIGCLVKDNTLLAQIVLMSVALGFSGVFGLIVIGVISYLNLRISFEESKKNGTLAPKNDTTVADKQAKNQMKDDQRATSGSF